MIKFDKIMRNFQGVKERERAWMIEKVGSLTTILQR